MVAVHYALNYMKSRLLIFLLSILAGAGFEFPAPKYYTQ